MTGRSLYDAPRALRVSADRERRGVAASGARTVRAPRPRRAGPVKDAERGSRCSRAPGGTGNGGRGRARSAPWRRMKPASRPGGKNIAEAASPDCLTCEESLCTPSGRRCERREAATRTSRRRRPAAVGGIDRNAPRGAPTGRDRSSEKPVRAARRAAVPRGRASAAEIVSISRAPSTAAWSCSARTRREVQGLRAAHAARAPDARAPAVRPRIPTRALGAGAADRRTAFFSTRDARAFSLFPSRRGSDNDSRRRGVHLSQRAQKVADCGKVTTSPPRAPLAADAPPRPPLARRSDGWGDMDVSRVDAWFREHSHPAAVNGPPPPSARTSRKSVGVCRSACARRFKAGSADLEITSCRPGTVDDVIAAAMGAPGRSRPRSTRPSSWRCGPSDGCVDRPHDDREVRAPRPSRRKSRAASQSRAFALLRYPRVADFLSPWAPPATRRATTRRAPRPIDD